MSSFITLLPLLAGSLASPGVGVPGPAPGNVLILLADDLGVDCVGCYGEGTTPPPTPTIDALAASGVLFRNAWSTPLCSPTRATIQTGRYGFRTGIGSHVGELSGAPALSPDEVTLPELVRASGTPWSTAAFGKWHLGNDDVGGLLAPNVAGYAHFAGTLGAISSYFAWTEVVDGVASPVTTYATTRTVDDALAWIGSAPEPWLCYVAFHAPHKPFHAPPPGLTTIDLSSTPPPSQAPRPYYEAMVQALDSEIGRLLASIPAQELASTTVIFLGDNGTPEEVTLPPFQAAHAKQTVYEGGINVPLIVTGPGVAAGAECDALVQTTDLFATVADLAGVSVPTAFPGLVLDSTSLTPYFASPALPSLRSTVFSEIFYPNGTSVPRAPACGGVPTRRPAQLCGRDVGLQGPGSAELSVCAHAGPTGWLLRLTGGAASAPGWILTATSPTSLPMHGGRVVSPLLFVEPTATDLAGAITTPVAGSSVYPELFYQVTLLDPAQPLGYSFSNAVRVESLSADMAAIRDARYKWIVDAGTCQEHFFDLATDPFEESDLIGTSLSPAERAALRGLRAALVALRRP